MSAGRIPSYSGDISAQITPALKAIKEEAACTSLFHVIEMYTQEKETMALDCSVFSDDCTGKGAVISAYQAVYGDSFSYDDPRDFDLVESPAAILTHNKNLMSRVMDKNLPRLLFIRKRDGKILLNPNKENQAACYEFNYYSPTHCTMDMTGKITAMHLAVSEENRSPTALAALQSAFPDADVTYI